jgi:cytochrome c oxidase cbb3-type subunit 3
MPTFNDILDASQIQEVAAYVASLSGMATDTKRTAAGSAIYTDNCAACHGKAGEGNPDLGAPNLADAIWLYGANETAIAQQVRSPRHGVMPAWHGRLNDTVVKQLAIFVHSLGGGR